MQASAAITLCPRRVQHRTTTTPRQTLLPCAARYPAALAIGPTPAPSPSENCLDEDRTLDPSPSSCLPARPFHASPRAPCPCLLPCLSYHFPAAFRANGPPPSPTVANSLRCFLLLTLHSSYSPSEALSDPVVLGLSGPACRPRRFAPPAHLAAQLVRRSDPPCFRRSPPISPERLRRKTRPRRLFTPHPLYVPRSGNAEKPDYAIAN